jgi:hypothetical protein
VGLAGVDRHLAGLSTYASHYESRERPITRSQVVVSLRPSYRQCIPALQRYYVRRRYSAVVCAKSYQAGRIKAHVERHIPRNATGLTSLTTIERPFLTFGTNSMDAEWTRGNKITSVVLEGLRRSENNNT